MAIESQRSGGSGRQTACSGADSSRSWGKAGGISGVIGYVMILLGGLGTRRIRCGRCQGTDADEFWQRRRRTPPSVLQAFANIGVDAVVAEYVPGVQVS